MPPYAYLRKSVVRDLASDLSHEVQEAKVRELAGQYGDNGTSLAILSDWDKSGRLGPDKRPGYRALLDAITSGQATAVYSYSLSRLGRSVAELDRLIRDCDARKIPVRLVVDRMDTSTASGKLLAAVLGALAAFEADIASERTLAANDARRARGQRVGTTPFYGDRPGEDPAAVLAAFHEAGSFSGAARLLNARSVKPRNGRVWWSSSVAVVVRRLDPSVRARPSRRGIRAGGASFALAGLLRCGTCGTVLTGWRDKRRTRYICRLSESLPHPRRSVAENALLPAIRAAVPAFKVGPATFGAPDEARRAALATARDRTDKIMAAFHAGAIDAGERDRRLHQVDDEIANVPTGDVVTYVARTHVDWENPAEANAELRRIWSVIELGPNLLPARFVERGG